jgi:protein SCO1/2
MTKQGTIRGKGWVAGFLLAACFGAIGLPAQVSQPGDKQAGPENDRPPAILDKVGIKQNLNTQLPLNLNFVDETGKAVQLGTYFGQHPAILALVYLLRRAERPHLRAPDG